MYLLNQIIMNTPKMSCKYLSILKIGFNLLISLFTDLLMLYVVLSIDGIVGSTEDILVTQVDNRPSLIVNNSTTGNSTLYSIKDGQSTVATTTVNILPQSVNHDNPSPIDIINGQITRVPNLKKLPSGYMSTSRNFMNHHPSMKGSSSSNPIRLSALRPAALISGSQFSTNQGSAIMAGSLVGHGHTMRQSFPDNCGSNVRLHERKGRINSPNYPFHWGNKTSCTWIIVGQPKDIVTIR